jgi:hypothetical protein
MVKIDVGRAFVGMVLAVKWSGLSEGPDLKIIDTVDPAVILELGESESCSTKSIPVHWVLGAFLPGHETGSLASGGKVKNVWSPTSTPCVLIVWYLQDSFTFTFFF